MAEEKTTVIENQENEKTESKAKEENKIESTENHNELEDLKKEIAEAQKSLANSENQKELEKGMKPFLDVLEKMNDRLEKFEKNQKTQKNETVLNSEISKYAKEINLSVADFKKITNFNPETSTAESIKKSFETMKDFYLKNANPKTGKKDPELEAKKYSKLLEDYDKILTT